jgi:hypothetical protein
MSTPKRAVRRPKVLPLVQVAPLSWGERLDILDALALVLDGVYAHLPLKRSLYGFDVIRALEHLRQQVPTMTDLQFHRELTLLVNRLRDAHTQYQGPWTNPQPVASLPFLVESYGPFENPSYVVSKIDRRSVRDPHFVVGVQLDHWNGVPFDRAVELHAETATGGRPDSRRARALESLTFRALEYAPPPNEEWVVIGYRDLKDNLREIHLDWEGIDPKRVATASQTLASRSRRAISPALEDVRRAKKYRFNPRIWNAERRMGAKRKQAGLSAEYSDFLSARTVTTKSGKFGYLRIWSFDVDDDEEFLKAVIQLLRSLPETGLILDVRNNPGGFIWAAERMLQLFTPNHVMPTKFALRATALTAAMSRAAFNQAELAPWAESLAAAEQTGEPYSSHLPITPPEVCNDMGQHYGGPVVVVADANTYSSGDLFTAGILDNRIGPVICIGAATGAGGANVWDSEDVRAALNSAKRPLPRLPKGVRFTVAMRRAVRSGPAEGSLIEDAGVPGQRYVMTREDLFNDNQGLIEYCGEILSTQPRSKLSVRRKGRNVTVETGGLDHIDVLFDGHPGESIAIRADGKQRVSVPAHARVLEVVGYTGSIVRQRRRLDLSSRT